MRVCFCLDMTVVAVENPLQVQLASSMNIIVAGKLGFSLLWCSNQ
jgi:hypothetical protein